MKPAMGHVTLLGAGPGDPDLLTVRAVRRLAEADLVLYDALSFANGDSGSDSPSELRTELRSADGVPSERASEVDAVAGVRALAPQARWFYVGKRARRESISQDTINRLLVREARRGRRVVRLKSGDPFVLGRGGEEALALVEAGVPFDVVPGVSSAIAAPALAGIPVTHRGLATGFVVASGHAESAWAPLVDGLPHSGATLVVLMAMGARGAIAARLMARGFDPATPAAVVLGAATAAEWRWIGRLADVADVTLPGSPGARPPGVLVVGAAVALAPVLRADAAPPQLLSSDSERSHGGTR